MGKVFMILFILAAAIIMSMIIGFWVWLIVTPLVVLSIVMKRRRRR